MSLFTDISSEMLYPIIPFFLKDVLGAPMALIGLIEGVAESTGNILKVVSGWYSDKTKKRKPFVLAGYSISAISKPLMALAYSWPMVLVARVMDRTGKGLAPRPGMHLSRNPLILNTGVVPSDFTGQWIPLVLLQAYS